ncbi:type 1 glutamine amidotransferase domain-containing protein [Chryseobacterium sp. L7]|uniref:Type 1 glutamine amidotransferase domain-containing protein n=1 Tax=Chryseobacterium endalhagicum TaxID=2797638 RepID=A0ABS1QCA9_9FLAO|nr:type 1 glutamine amidotransferase domain-containing protein [Chryseobacterium endalhagicum]MBL1220248.1 type 1 glutamine amidotransferase domain-containing protein [Chryseobacterium endalhagicum]
MRRNKILVYTSSATKIPLKEGGTHNVGIFLGELVDPIEPLIEAGHEIEFVSPDGKGCIIDEKSYNLSNWGLSKKRMEHAKRYFDTKLQDLGIGSPQKLSDLLNDKEKLNSYDVLFIPGGHAPMTDVLHTDWLVNNNYNKETGKLLFHFHNNNKITAAICHGSAALGSAPFVNDKWIYDGYNMTCVSMAAEYITEDIPFFGIGGHMPDYPVKILERLGGIVHTKMLSLSNVINDRELITGQDPYSAKELGEKLLDKIKNWK